MHSAASPSHQSAARRAGKFARRSATGDLVTEPREVTATATATAAMGVFVRLQRLLGLVCLVGLLVERRLLGRRIFVRLFRATAARDVRGDLRQLWQDRERALPAVRFQARLLQRLFREPPLIDRAFSTSPISTK